LRSWLGFIQVGQNLKITDPIDSSFVLDELVVLVIEREFVDEKEFVCNDVFVHFPDVRTLKFLLHLDIWLGLVPVGKLRNITQTIKFLPSWNAIFQLEFDLI
jgi:hypothetical protein